MSQENVDAVRTVYRAWGEGDPRGNPAVYDPHLVYVSEPDDPERGPHYGLEAANAYYRRFLDAWDDWRIEATEYREAGDSIVVRARRTGTGKSSRIPMEDESFHVWTFRGAKAIRIEVFQTEAEALEAVGLRD